MTIVSLIEEIQSYADGRKSDVARGAETPALAALMVEKYGEGLATAVHLMGADNSHLMRELDRLVREIDPQYPKHRQYRFEARPAGLSINGKLY
ncbi:hypothetical protein DF117_27425 [Burkholderia stagnalis]|uniref:hypothetical protein n=1 Tax=Burkholderia stagnalis TaxID=1503054 RepID=UPI000F600B4A|nr:hypothetical protein [Burkholderia stagnalis]RQY14864.1 hypothetical protein DF117_27425 [Burkholderia stagnalis]